MESINAAEYVRLRNEYHVTLRVLALVVERLLIARNSDLLELSESEVLHAPDLHAFRDEAQGIIGLRTER